MREISALLLQFHLLGEWVCIFSSRLLFIKGVESLLSLITYMVVNVEKRSLGVFVIPAIIATFVLVSYYS